jgi:hypothetical protein
LAPPGDKAAPAKKTVYGYVYAANPDGNVYRQKISDDAKFLKKPKVVFKHNNTLQYMVVRNIDAAPGTAPPAVTPNVLILWQKKVTETKHEGWAYLTRVKE